MKGEVECMHHADECKAAWLDCSLVGIHSGTHPMHMQFKYTNSVWLGLAVTKDFRISYFSIFQFSYKPKYARVH